MFVEFCIRAKLQNRSKSIAYIFRGIWYSIPLAFVFSKEKIRQESTAFQFSTPQLHLRHSRNLQVLEDCRNYRQSWVGL